MVEEKISKQEFEKALKQSKSRLESAEILLKKEKYRDSISRSYYAVFDIVRAILATKGIVTKTHIGALQQFALHFVKTNIFEKEFSDRLNRLFERRQQADYDWQEDSNIETAQDSLLKAKEFINAAEILTPKIFEDNEQ